MADKSYIEESEPLPEKEESVEWGYEEGKSLWAASLFEGGRHFFVWGRESCVKVKYTIYSGHQCSLIILSQCQVSIERINFCPIYTSLWFGMFMFCIEVKINLKAIELIPYLLLAFKR